MLHAERKIRRADEVSTKSNGDVVSGVHLAHHFASLLRSISTSDYDWDISPASFDERIQLNRAIFCCLIHAVSGTSRDSAFDKMDVGEVQLQEFFGDVGEGVNGAVTHAHSLEVDIGRKSDGDLFAVTDGFYDGFGHLKAEAGTLLDAASPSICALVADVLPELVDEVAIGA